MLYAGMGTMAYISRDNELYETHLVDARLALDVVNWSANNDSHVEISYECRMHVSSTFELAQS